ncbi:MAG: hypothetical protein ACLP2J_06430 [Acidimicrobiales bacterium]|jgi:hypothetical protein
MATFDPELLVLGRDVAAKAYLPIRGHVEPFLVPDDLDRETITRLLPDAGLAGVQPWTVEGTPFFIAGVAISRWHQQLHDRFVMLLGMHTTLASVARVLYGQAPLTADDFTLHLAASVLFFDGFTRR